MTSDRRIKIALVTAITLILSSYAGWLSITSRQSAEIERQVDARLAEQQAKEDVADTAAAVIEHLKALCADTDTTDPELVVACDQADQAAAEVAQETNVRYVPVPGRSGKDGADGKDGTDGTDGADGTDGPTLTQVVAAIAADVDRLVGAAVRKAFAACVQSGECVGEPGPRPTSIECDGSDGIFTYPDAVTYRVPDMCQQPPTGADPTPTEGTPSS
jgi:hypothetical protein